MLIEVAGAENVEGFNVTSAFVQDENDERNQKFVADYTELRFFASLRMTELYEL